jgi:hypothetical protein
MLLDQPFIEFATHFYGEQRLQWRTAVAEALGLLQQQELGDYRYFFKKFFFGALLICGGARTAGIFVKQELGDHKYLFFFGALCTSSGAPSVSDLNYRRIRGVCSCS